MRKMQFGVLALLFTTIFGGCDEDSSIEEGVGGSEVLVAGMESGGSAGEADLGVGGSGAIAVVLGGSGGENENGVGGDEVMESAGGVSAGENLAGDDSSEAGGVGGHVNDDVGGTGGEVEPMVGLRIVTCSEVFDCMEDCDEQEMGGGVGDDNGMCGQPSNCEQVCLDSIHIEQTHRRVTSVLNCHCGPEDALQRCEEEERFCAFDGIWNRGAEEAQVCAELCDLISDCSEGRCEDGGFDIDQCEQDCLNGDQAIRAVDTMDRCDSVSGFLGLWSESYQVQCFGDAVPECELWVEKVSQCMVEADICPGLEAHEERITKFDVQICNSILREEGQLGFLDGARGEAVPALEDATCDDERIRTVLDIVSESLQDAADGQGGAGGEGADDVEDPSDEYFGLLVPYCVDGPGTEDCADACSKLSVCLPPEVNELRIYQDVDFCILQCLRNKGEWSWPCMDELDVPDERLCPNVWRCFGGNNQVCEPEPEVQILELCESTVGFVADCVVDECAATVEFREVMIDSLALGCSQAVENPDEPFTEQILMDLAALAQENFAMFCQSEQIGEVVQSFIGEADPDEGNPPGLFHYLCEDELFEPLDASVCQTACAHLSACVPENTCHQDFDDLEQCELRCRLSDPDARQSWQCLQSRMPGDRGVECLQVLSCF